MGVFADTGKNVEHFATAPRGVLDAIGGEQGKAMTLGQIDQPAIGALFASHEVALQLDINSVAPESIEQPLRAVRETLRLGSTGCYPVVCGSLPQTFSQARCDSTRGIRQPAGRDGLTARAPQKDYQPFTKVR